jgi:hypothetical protein
MANTLELGNGKWATSKDTVLAFNDENNNFKPLPFSFSRDSSATVVNKDGLIETVGVGEPRIDFKDNTKGALLLEPERTNLLPYSEDYSQSVFTRRNCTINQNYAISPSGLLDATLVSANGSDAAIFDNIGVTSGNTYTLSVYLRVESGTLDTTLSLGSAGFPNTSGDGGRVKDITITTEWKRFTLTSTADANAGSDIGIIGGFGGFNNGDSVLIYGAQLESGSYATSYIPTQGTIQTRVQETASGSGNSEVFNDSEGVLFADIAALSNDGTFRYIGIFDSQTSNVDRIQIYYRNDANKISFLIEENDTNQFFESIDVNVENYNKCAFQYGSTTKVYINGFLVAEESGITIPNNLQKLSFTEQDGGDNFYGKTKEISYYDEVLTDLELETLTSYRSWLSMVNELNLNVIYNG